MNLHRDPLNEDEIINQLASHYEAIINLLGEDSSRPGLEKTPRRAAKALWYATRGYRQSIAEVVNDAIFPHEGSQMIIVKDIEFYSLCEHHLLPFFGTISVGYIPDGKIIGISKIARLVEMYARRLQVQERLTQQICTALNDILPTRGVIAHCTAEHLCMKLRGVEKQQASTTTLDYNGLFATEPALRTEFLNTL